MAKSKLKLESLHSRALPSATLAGGVLTVTGTDGNDLIVVRQIAGAISVRGMQIDVGGTLQSSVPAASVTAVDVNALGGNDRVRLGTLHIGATVDAGGGNDSVLGGLGDDSVSGGVGDDVLNGAAGDDSINGGAGDDRELGARGNDDLAGDVGDDSLNGGLGDDSIQGGDGNDHASGELGDDSLNGGAGDDSVNGGMGNDDVNGEAGDDSVSGGLGRDDLRGGTGDDSAFGGLGDDSVHGGLGDDMCRGGPGRDEVNGDTGSDDCRGGENHGSGADFRAGLTNANGQTVGEAEAQTEDNGQTEFEVEVHGAAANTTFDVTIDVAGDGSNVISVGQFVTNAEGEGELEVHNLANVTLQDGVSVLHLTANPADPTKNLSGTFLAHTEAAANELNAILLDPADPTGPRIGKAELKPEAGEFQVEVFTLAANTTYDVFVNGNATTGTLVGHLTTDHEGEGKLELLTDASFPSVQAGSVVTVADSTGTTVIQGTFAAGDDD
jgi:Ca2+-binding RTX toxin-like protein